MSDDSKHEFVCHDWWATKAVLREMFPSDGRSEEFSRVRFVVEKGGHLTGDLDGDTPGVDVWISIDDGVWLSPRYTDSTVADDESLQIYAAANERVKRVEGLEDLAFVLAVVDIVIEEATRT